MTDVASLGIKVDSKGVVKATNELDRLENQGKKTEKQTKNLTRSAVTLGKAFGVAVVAATAAVAVATFRVNREFEVLKTTLITVTGSAEKAEIVFDGIKVFATELPFSIQELTQAFITLGNLGLTPSERAIKSYANTASATGHSLQQMIEAVADATTGEFERLKEFGIKSKSEGDNVTFVFNKVATTIGKNATEIENYLLNLGETKFAGAAIRQMETMDGAISNLGVAWQGFLDTLLSDENEKLLANAINNIGAGIDFLNRKLSGTKNLDDLIGESGEAFAKVAKLQKEIDKANKEKTYARPGVFTELKEAEKVYADLQKQIWEFKGDSTFALNQIAEEIGSGKVSESFKSLIEDFKLAPEAMKALARDLDSVDADIDAKIEFQTDIESLRTSLNTALETEEEYYQERLALIFEYGKKGAEEQIRAGDLLERETQRHEDAMATIKDRGVETVDTFKEMERAIDGWGRTFADAMVDSTGSFDDFVENMLDQLQRIAIQQASQPIFDMFGSVLSSVGAGLFGGAVGVSSLPAGGGAIHVAGARAEGGSVSAGKPYLIGEEGAEIMVPRTSGTVIPNNKIGSGGDINVTVNVSSSGTKAQGDKDGLDFGRMLGDAVRSVLIQEKRSGGLLN